MKKYLITGITALAICFGFTSCSHDLDSLSQDEIDQLEAQKIVNTYQRAFKAYIGGEVAPTQNWGFGSIASARTRAIDEEGATFSHVEQPQKWSCPVNDLHFRDDKNKDIPVVEMPTFTHTVSDAVYADNITNWDNQKIISIDGKYTTFTTKDEQIIYVIDDATYAYTISNNGRGTLFIVKSGKTLTLGSVGHNMQVYLEANATLNVTHKLNEDGTEKTGDDHSFLFEKSNAAIYLNSGSTITGTNVRFYDGCKVLNNGGTIQVTNLTVDKGSVLINNGSFSNVTNLTVNNENAIIYNAPNKTLEAKNLKMDNNYALLFNDINGTVKITRGIEYYNSTAEIVNHGTLTSPSIDFKAGGMFKNTDSGTTTVYGTTSITNTNSSWENDGVYTSGDFVVENAIKIFNNCKLTVTARGEGMIGTGTFSIGGDVKAQGTESGSDSQGAFVLNGNNSVKADHMNLRPNGDFFFGANSLLWVVNELNAVNNVTGCGLHGPTAEATWGIVKAGSVVYDAERTDGHRWSINYYDNLYIDTDSHFPQGHDDKLDQSHQPWYYYSTEKKTVMFKFLGDNCPITENLDPEKCYHGYNTNPNPDPDPDPEFGNLRIMAEDLSASDRSDFDFNDIVFDVEFNTTGEGTTKIMVWAAGGTLPLRIALYRDNEEKSILNDDEPTQWQEIHALWGEETNIMINTNAEKKYPGKGVTYKDADGNYIGQEVTLQWPVANEADAKDIVIKVKKNGKWVEMEAEQGKPAAKFAVPTTVGWMDERYDIKRKYGKFCEWATTAPEIKWWRSDLADDQDE